MELGTGKFFGYPDAKLAKPLRPDQATGQTVMMACIFGPLTVFCHA